MLFKTDLVVLLVLCFTHVNGHNWWGGYCDSCVEAAVEDCDHYNANPGKPIEGDFWLSQWCNWSCSQKMSEACQETTITDCETECASEIDNDKDICARLDKEYKNIFGSAGDRAKSRACVEQCSPEMEQKCVEICSECLTITEDICLKILTIPSLCPNGDEKIEVETEINGLTSDHCMSSCKMRMENQCQTTNSCLQCDSAIINKNHCGYLSELKFGLNPIVTETSVNQHLGDYKKADGSSLNCVAECAKSMNSICDGLANTDEPDWIDTEEWNHGDGYNCDAYRENEWCDGKCGAGRHWLWWSWGDIKCSEGDPLKNCARSCGCGNEFPCVDRRPGWCSRKIIDDTYCIRGQCEVPDGMSSHVLGKCAKSCGCCKSCENTYCAGDATCSMDETNFCTCSDGSECIIDKCHKATCSDNESCDSETGDCKCGTVGCHSDATCAVDESDAAVCTCNEGFEGNGVDECVGLPTDPCDNITCNNVENCESGVCICGGTTCVGDEICTVGVEGVVSCVNPPTNPCDGVNCPLYETCIGESGTAVCFCGTKECEASETCIDRDDDGRTLICTPPETAGILGQI